MEIEIISLCVNVVLLIHILRLTNYASILEKENRHLLRLTANAKQAAKHVKQLYDRLFESYNSAIVMGVARVHPKTDLVLKCNDAFCVIAGWEPQKLVGVSWKEFTHEGCLYPDTKHVNAMLKGDIDDYVFFKRYIGQRGQTVYVKLYVTLQRDEYGEPEYFLATIWRSSRSEFVKHRGDI